MNRITRPAAALGVTALLAFSLAACGGDAPTDASVEDFCNAFNDSPDDIDPQNDAASAVDAVHDYADNLNEVGTPEGISEDARHGFETLVDALSDVDEDDVAEEDSDRFSAQQKADVEALTEYVGKTCETIEQ